MASTKGTLPASLLPASRDEVQDEALTSLLGRIFEERGHFRHVTEQSLEAEIATEEAQESSSDAEDEDEETGENDDVDSKGRREHLYAVKTQLLELVAYVIVGILVQEDMTDTGQIGSE